MLDVDQGDLRRFSLWQGRWRRGVLLRVPLVALVTCMGGFPWNVARAAWWLW